MLTRQLEQHERARCIHGEISHGITCSPIMRRLCGSMDYDGNIPVVAGKNLCHRIAIANIRIEMDVALDAALVFLPMPDRARVCTEEYPPHIIINAGNVKALVSEKAN